MGPVTRSTFRARTVPSQADEDAIDTTVAAADEIVLRLADDVLAARG